MAFARTFLSFDPPPAIVADLSALQQRLREALPDVSWALPAQFHSTITFLGSIDELSLPALLREISAVTSAAHSFGVSYEGLGVFPDTGPPEVLWVGCVSADGRLGVLKEALDGAVRRTGIALETRSFHPHVTLGRIRQAHDVRDLIPMLESLTFEPRRTRIDAIHLMNSTRSPQGALHSVLATNSLQPSEPSARA